MFNDLAKQKKDISVDAQKIDQDLKDKSSEEKKTDDLAIHTIPDRFLGKLDNGNQKAVSKNTSNKGFKKEKNKTLVIILVIGFIFLSLLGGVAFFFLQSVKKPVSVTPENNIQKEIEKKVPLPVCSPFNCSLCLEDECKDFLDSCHVEESLEDINDEKVFVTNCLEGSQSDYQAKIDEEKKQAEDEYNQDVGDDPEGQETKNITLGNDFDNDGLADIEEDLWGTDMSQKDSDGDSFSDGLEVVSLYDPTKEDQSKLTENFSLIQSSTNKKYGFSFFYPKKFTKIADSSNRILLQSDQTTEYFEISILENVGSLSLLENVYAMYNPQNIDDFIKYEGEDVEKISSSDKMIYYVLNDDYIFQFYYSPSVDFKAHYMATFQSLINSFEFINDPFSFEQEQAGDGTTGNESEL
jgi:hypothetical protein